MKTLIAHQKLSCRFYDFIFAGIFPYSEKNIRKYIPKQYLQWVGSARSGLSQLLSQGEKVGLQSFTCHVVLDAVLKAQAIPIFIDSGAILTAEDVEKNIKRIDTLIVSYNFGFMPNMEKITSICKKSNVRLIEDCAQALGAISDGKLAGSFGEAAIYSFGISKNIGLIGGIVATDKPFLYVGKNYPRLSRYFSYAKSSMGNLFFNLYIYNYTSPLFKYALKPESVKDYLMPDFAKYVVLSQARRYHKMLELRKKNANYLMKELSGIVEFVKPEAGTEPAWLYFVVQHKNRDALRSRLLKENIDVQPLHTFTDISRNSEKAQLFEKTHLAFALLRSEKETEEIGKAIKRVLKNA